MSRKLSNEDIQMYKRISGLIKERRETLGIKQSTLAEKAGISPQHLSLIESNRKLPSLPLVRCLFTLLEIPYIPIEDTPAKFKYPVELTDKIEMAASIMNDISARIKKDS